MKSRLFTFGCSFTRYCWPTWAEIMALDFHQCQNWGHVGGGNHFIFYSLIEAIAREKIQTSDTVAIMWTSVGREDRWLDGRWFLQGSIYNSDYPKNYKDEFTDPTGFLITSVTLKETKKKK